MDDVRLLPHFDVYLLGHRSKSHLVDDAHYKRVYRAAGWISPVVLINGRVAGVWSYKKRAGSVRITVEPFGRLTNRQRKAIESSAAHVAGFFDSSHELTFTGTATGNPAN